MLTENDKHRLLSILRNYHEWLSVWSNGRNFAFRTSEIEIEFTRGKIFFGFPDGKGFQTWRVENFDSDGEKVLLKLTKNFSIENEKITLVPRISAHELSAIAELARAEKAQQIAEIFAVETESKIIRVELNKENGRIAEIISTQKNDNQIAVSSDVTNSLSPEILLSAAILRLRKLQNRKKNPIDKIVILAQKKQAGALQKLHSVLRNIWQEKVLINELSENKNSVQNQQIKQLKVLSLKDLQRGKKKNSPASENFSASEAAKKIVEIAPDEIDLIFSKNGETLRFQGLPFARVRKISDEEKVWFGVETKRQILSEKTFEDFVKLIDELKIYRCHNSPNKRHDFYRLAPESWLESIFRRNIKLLDANLILSPIHRQFRTEREKIDLLALRKDGRLVIIELKTAPDREMIFQAADYWRKIEIERRNGNLQAAKFFGDAEIADQPTLVYLVAPTLSFHHEFSFFALTIRTEPEIFRFDLNEDWRRKIRVFQREKF